MTDEESDSSEKKMVKNVHLETNQSFSNSEDDTDEVLIIFYLFYWNKIHYLFSDIMFLSLCSMYFT